VRPAREARGPCCRWVDLSKARGVVEARFPARAAGKNLSPQAAKSPPPQGSGTRPARILIHSPGNAPCPATPAIDADRTVAPRHPEGKTRGGQCRTRQARRRGLRNPRQAVATATSTARRPETGKGRMALSTALLATKAKIARQAESAPGRPAAWRWTPWSRGLPPQRPAFGWPASHRPAWLTSKQPARIRQRPASPAATRIITRPALIVITAPHRPGRTGWAKPKRRRLRHLFAVGFPPPPPPLPPPCCAGRSPSPLRGAGECRAHHMPVATRTMTGQRMTMNSTGKMHNHHRHRELGGQAVGLLLGARQTLVAHVVGINAQRVA